MYKKQEDFLIGNFESGNLAHAYLFSGQDVESIENFTKELLGVINSAIPQSAGMIKIESFPDLLLVKSQNSKSSQDNEKDMMEISIEQIRNAQNFLSYKSYYGNFKAVIIENAERMTTEAQNCFLKSLEEPKGKTVIFLLTSRPDLILPTIFSRCQQVKFFYKGKQEVSKDEEMILQNIKKVINSDLAGKFNYTKTINLEGEKFNKILNILQKYFRQNLLSEVGVIEKKPTLEGRVFTAGQTSKILRLIEKLSYQTSIYNINEKLALEVLLMEI